jgi:hypothetical protein
MTFVHNRWTRNTVTRITVNQRLIIRYVSYNSTNPVTSIAGLLIGHADSKSVITWKRFCK